MKNSTTEFVGRFFNGEKDVVYRCLKHCRFNFLDLCGRIDRAVYLIR